MRRLLLFLIFLATLPHASVAQSREASILNSLIYPSDTLRANPSDTVQVPVSAENSIISLVSILKHDTVKTDTQTLVSPLTYIYRCFLPSKPSDTADPSDPAIFIAYLRRCGPLTSPYGWRKSKKKVHHGVDVSMAVGDTVRAALSGTVERIDCQPHGYGHYVVLAHEGGLETRYAHLKCALVTPGQYVTAGEPIALSGNSGNSTGPHLHFETRRMKIPFNPLGDLTLPATNLPPTPRPTPKPQ